MKKILMTGADGLVGSRFVEMYGEKYQLLTPHYSVFDITKKDSVASFAKENPDIDLIIHLAAYTNVDLAEKESELVYQINVEGTQYIYDLATLHGTRLIHFSTDFIFDGTDGPYDESSVPNAHGVYGKTKLQAEEIVEDYASIIRLCFPYRKDFAPKKDFVRSIASLLLSGVKLNMVTDALITPTFIDDIAFGLDKMIDLPEKKIVHLVGSSAYSPFDCAIIIAKKIGANRELSG